jgi:hypothetical protein
MPLFRALAKNMAASYFGESALRFCNGSYTSVCLYSVAWCWGIQILAVRCFSGFFWGFFLGHPVQYTVTLMKGLC